MGKQRERRRELTLHYAGIDDDTEGIYLAPQWKPEPLRAEPKQEVAAPPRCEGWPFDAAEAQRRQQNGSPVSVQLDLGDGVTMTLVRIPAVRSVGHERTARRRLCHPRDSERPNLPADAERLLLPG